MILQSFLSIEDESILYYQKDLVQWSKKFDGSLKPNLRIKNTLAVPVRVARKEKVNMDEDSKALRKLNKSFGNTYFAWIGDLREAQQKEILVLPTELGKLLSRDLRFLRRPDTFASARLFPSTPSGHAIIKNGIKTLSELLSVNVVASNTKSLIEKRRTYQRKYEAIVSRPCTETSQFSLIYMPVSIAFSGNALRTPDVLKRFEIKHDILSIDSKRDRTDIVYHDMPVLIFNANFVRNKVVESKLENVIDQIASIKETMTATRRNIKLAERNIEELNKGINVKALSKERTAKRAELNALDEQITSLRTRIEKLKDEDKRARAEALLESALTKKKAAQARVRTITKRLKTKDVDDEFTETMTRLSALQDQLERSKVDLKSVNIKKKKIEKSVSEKSADVLSAGLGTIIDQINDRCSEEVALISDNILSWKGGNSLALLMSVPLRNLFDSLQSGGLRVHSWELPWKSGADYTKIKALAEAPLSRGGR